MGLLYLYLYQYTVFAGELLDFQHITLWFNQILQRRARLIVKVKAISLQAWRDPECSTRFRLTDFKTIGT